jgi:hypothetical protein
MSSIWANLDHELITFTIRAVAKSPQHCGCSLNLYVNCNPWACNQSRRSRHEHAFVSHKAIHT